MSGFGFYQAADLERMRGVSRPPPKVVFIAATATCHESFGRAAVTVGHQGEIDTRTVRSDTADRIWLPETMRDSRVIVLERGCNQQILDQVADYSTRCRIPLIQSAGGQDVSGLVADIMRIIGKAR